VCKYRCRLITNSLRLCCERPIPSCPNIQHYGIQLPIRSEYQRHTSELSSKLANSHYTHQQLHQHRKLHCLDQNSPFRFHKNIVEYRLSGMSGTWPAPDKRFFWILDILTKYIIVQYIFVNNAVRILMQFNALKHQLSTQRYEPSTTAHVVKKLLTAVVAFGTTIPNRPLIITLFGCSGCLDSRIKDVLLYMNFHNIAKRTKCFLMHSTQQDWKGVPLVDHI
jgi:hypothetical protein